jgi:hypothetical protein
LSGNFDVQINSAPGGPVHPSISLGINDQGPSTLLSISALDYPDAAFLVSQNSGSPTFSFQFNYDADDPRLSMPGDHVLTFSISDTVAAHNFDLAVKTYVFNAFPTLDPAQPAASSNNQAPTYAWTLATADYEVLFMFVADSLGNTVYQTVVSRNATSFTHPADYPLAPGTYTWTLFGMHFENGVVGNQTGSAIVSRTFIVTP